MPEQPCLVKVDKSLLSDLSADSRPQYESNLPLQSFEKTFTLWRSRLKFLRLLQICSEHMMLYIIGTPSPPPESKFK